MPNIPGLRSPYDKLGRIVYLGRMIDKIRLHAAGKLPPEYVENMGDTSIGVFDTRCCRFLGIAHAVIKEKVLSGASDDEVLAFVEGTAPRRSDDDCYVWNCFMMKRGWHDPAANVKRLGERISESGLQGRGIETFFDYLDLDEGRDPVAVKRWESFSG